MDNVKILTAQSLETALKDVEKISAAKMHAGMRAGRAIRALHKDCRPLAQLMEEAEAAHWLGQPDRSAFITNVLEWPVRTIDLALEGLRWFDPAEPVPLEAAATKGAEVAARAAAAPCEVGPGQGARTDMKPSDIIRKLSKEGGTGADYLAARIKRDHPDIAERLLAGEFTSMRKAAIAAGIVKEPTGLARLRAAWNAASEEDRRTFLATTAKTYMAEGE